MAVLRCDMTGVLATCPPYVTYARCTGDYYNEGKVREKELVNSAGVLGIAADRVEVVNDPYVVLTNYFRIIWGSC